MADDEDLGSNIEPETPIRVQKKTPATTTVEKPATTRIILEETEDIPPTGLFVSHNGRPYLIRAGEPVDVPNHIIDILDHAVMSTPMTDPNTKQVIGYRERMRYPYRLAK